MDENKLSEFVIKQCIDIHRSLGPGLLESVYEKILCYELNENGIPFESQVPIPVQYKGKTIDVAFRADLIVDGKLVMELKSCESITSVHKKILISYLKITGIKLGLLINFREELLKHGITRVVNNLD